LSRGADSLLFTIENESLILLVFRKLPQKVTTILILAISIDFVKKIDAAKKTTPLFL
jgi:hypothetical protein